MFEPLLKQRVLGLEFSDHIHEATLSRPRVMEYNC